MNIRQWKYPLWLKIIYSLLPVALIFFWGYIATDLEKAPFNLIVRYSVYSILILSWPVFFILEVVRLGFRLYHTPAVFMKFWTGIFLGVMLILTLSIIFCFKDAYSAPYMTTLILPENGSLLLALLFGYCVDSVIVLFYHFIRLIRMTMRPLQK